MSQYSIGFATVKNNSASVWGASCDWLTASAAKVGHLFKIQGSGAWYTITSVVNATKITISPLYALANASSEEYTITRDFTPNYSFPEQNEGDYDWTYAYTRAMRMIDTQFATITESYRTYIITSGSGRMGWAVSYCSTEGQVRIANASATTDLYPAVGVIASDIDTTVSVQHSGKVFGQSGNLVSTPNTRYYLKAWDTTATYNLTTTPPTTEGYALQYVGANRSATALLVNIDDYIGL
jgi:hypothetical protein